jgi:hypothetical protein
VGKANVDVAVTVNVGVIVGVSVIVGGNVSVAVIAGAEVAVAAEVALTNVAVCVACPSGDGAQAVANNTSNKIIFNFISILQNFLQCHPPEGHCFGTV